MKPRLRTALEKRALAGYVHGPNAPIEATDAALEKAESASAVILVEGISDQIAIETLATRVGRDLEAEGVCVVPVGGAQAVMRFMRAFGPLGKDLPLCGLYDFDATATYRKSLAKAKIGHPTTVEDIASLGFYVCMNDLEDELIRALGPEEVELVIESQGELRAFRTFQKQPEWRGEPAADQLHRFIGAKARRSLRYARLLIEAIEPHEAPAPFLAVLYPQEKRPSQF